MKTDFLRAFIAVVFSLEFAACGGGGGDSAAPPSSSAGFIQTYMASATAGEVLTYTIDTQMKTYSYEVVFSAYGLNATGSGTLTVNTDGSYSPSEAPSSKVYALQNGLLVGAVKLVLGGIPRIVPIVGVSNPISTASSLEGTYNYISLLCANQSFGVTTGCPTSYGTIQVLTTGTYTTCDKSNIANGIGGCSSSTTGTLASLGNGVWSATRTGSTNKNYFMAFNAPDGQKVALIDLNDTGGYGYGLVVMSSQAGYSQGLVDGTWFFLRTDGINGSLTISGQNMQDSFGNKFTATFDSPWIGLSTINNGINNGGRALVAGNGAYAYADSTVFELGMKK